MSILLEPISEGGPWRELLAAELPDMRIQVWPDVEDPDAVEFAVMWRRDAEELRRFRNLRAILAMTAGVEKITGPGYPDVPVVRLSDEAMADEMAAYTVHWVIHFHRNLDIYLEQQKDREWRPIRPAEACGFPVGFLGYGIMGRRVGRALTGLGYPVGAWTRTGGNDPEITNYRGRRGLEEMLGSSAAVVNILPLTAETAGLMDAGRFACFRENALYISVGRGATTVQADLLDALNGGPLGAAVLDVTEIEPLPADSPLWNHPRVRITPHMSGFTRARTAAPLVAENIRRIRRGEQPFPLFDPKLGY